IQREDQGHVIMRGGYLWCRTLAVLYRGHETFSVRVPGGGGRGPDRYQRSRASVVPCDPVVSGRPA
ncbi:hypothetical protein, partial [Rhodococcus qingshengii]|uniref:hypothetical protein n=1 Tax=Rhodococcus qingshengii TaxID=334542 RepID=UPI0036F87BBD